MKKLIEQYEGQKQEQLATSKTI